ncbi:hypothetical protein CR205_02920 [Alteribacter lacisalsi]|uniref:Class I SAM-dependent methyltransferase n=1 Tax=Alteribacter lacisalsi TaxID=2045244 RepID=A0A2W0H6T4_9BACI|nr:class I SAM-dependent methyltransferase [Alteribacter lacisalsi]PYZ97564.1 hypothetical protein CR205_02920 [Alteribacter lacisalsi]
MEENSKYYDVVYKEGGYNGNYHKPYQNSPYFPIWKNALVCLRKLKDPIILDVGCGVGQFANMLFDNGFTHYRGFDFSEEAVRQSKKNNPDYAEAFSTDNAYTTDLFTTTYNTAVLFEVLEHLEHDKDVLGKVRTGSNVLLSVPNFHTRGHVRYFLTEDSVISRYEDLVQIDEILPYRYRNGQVIYLVSGLRRDQLENK